MEYCPACKSQLSPNTESCTICNKNINSDRKQEWIHIGSIQDSISSDYAKETLDSYNIPVVIISNSGMFGTVGLNLSPFHSNSVGLFDVSVPEDFVDEALEILNMILGESFFKKE